MAKTIIISNRLPVQLQIDNEGITALPSVGGLATGMKSVHSGGDSLWIGWSGLTEEEIAEGQGPLIDKALAEHGSLQVPLTQEDVDGFYFKSCHRQRMQPSMLENIFSEFISKIFLLGSGLI